MRCSQCGHITDAERYTCPSCGQGLSPGSDRPPSAVEFPKVSEPIGPLADLDLDQTHAMTTTAPPKQPLTEPIAKVITKRGSIEFAALSGCGCAGADRRS